MKLLYIFVNYFDKLENKKEGDVCLQPHKRITSKTKLAE